MYDTRRSIVLGSASPRRRELLALAGVVFETRATQVPEEALAGERPEGYVARLARDKALAASAATPDAVTIGADTVVVLDGAILGKPRDPAEAMQMLRWLAGRGHEVLTGFTMASRGEVLAAEVVRTEVDFRALTEGEIRAYVASGEPSDKAGAYGIQGLGALFVRGIRGSYTNVVGLPLVEVLEALVRVGAIAPRAPGPRSAAGR